MKIKTSELTGPALDWAVAKSEGERYGPPTFRVHQNSKGATVYLNTGMQQSGIPYRPSTDWAQGGPIIEREGITLRSCIDGAAWDAELAYEETILAPGPTPLIAAMRCYVASKLGDEVDIPEELLP